MVCTSFMATAQKSLPDLLVTNLEGEKTNINELSKEKVIIMSFWATWCEPCLKELNALNDNQTLIEQDLNARLISVSIDDSRTFSRIKPLIHGNLWTFEVVTDVNQEIKRKLNILNIPHTLLIYQNKIVHETTGYIIGDETFLFEKIRDLNSQ